MLEADNLKAVFQALVLNSSLLETHLKLLQNSLLKLIEGLMRKTFILWIQIRHCHNYCLWPVNQDADCFTRHFCQQRNFSISIGCLKKLDGYLILEAVINQRLQEGFHCLFIRAPLNVDDDFCHASNSNS